MTEREQNPNIQPIPPISDFADRVRLHDEDEGSVVFEGLVDEKPLWGDRTLLMPEVEILIPSRQAWDKAG